MLFNRAMMHFAAYAKLLKIEMIRLKIIKNKNRYKECREEESNLISIILLDVP